MRRSPATRPAMRHRLIALAPRDLRRLVPGSLGPNRATRMARMARRPRTADGDLSRLLRNVPPPQVRWPRASGGAREGRQGRRNDTARVEDESPGEVADAGRELDGDLRSSRATWFWRTPSCRESRLILAGESRDREQTEGSR